MIFPFDQPCVGCGHCCCTSVCVFGQTNGGVEYDDLPCPLLRYDGKRHWCRLVEEMRDEDITDGLAIGEGCSSGLSSWRKEPIPDRTQQ